MKPYLLPAAQVFCLALLLLSCSKESTATSDNFAPPCCNANPVKSEIEGRFFGESSGRRWGFFQLVDTVIGITPIYSRVDYDSVFFAEDSLLVKLVGNSRVELDFYSTPEPDFPFQLQVENPATNEESAFFRYEYEDEDSGARTYARASFFYESDLLIFDYAEDSGSSLQERRQVEYTYTAARREE